ncbi:MAG: S16 family serine protease [Candidatus Izemoplasmatales bacterium]
MIELFRHYRKQILLLAFPYLLIMFLLIYPANLYVYSPGGLSEVERLIQVDYNEDKITEGTISSTYIMTIERPSFYEFIIGYLNPFSDIGILTGSNLTYTNDEINQISYLDKATSVDAAIIVAYQQAQLANPDIQITLNQVTLVFGKATYLDHYDEIDFGDKFLYVEGDEGTVVTIYTQIATYTTEQNEYTFHFQKEDGTEYSVLLSKDETTHLFGITLKNYYLVDQDDTYPNYNVVDSSIGGPSGGLLQTLAIYNMLIDEDITHGLKIAGTGTINYDGSVGYIGGVKQKIATAYLNHVDVFFIPYLDDTYTYDNYLEALRACEELGIDPEGWLVPVASFSDAINYLNSLGGDSE